MWYGVLWCGVMDVVGCVMLWCGVVCCVVI